MTPSHLTLVPPATTLTAQAARYRADAKATAVMAALETIAHANESAQRLAELSTLVDDLAPGLIADAVRLSRDMELTLLRMATVARHGSAR